MKEKLSLENKTISFLYPDGAEKRGDATLPHEVAEALGLCRLLSLGADRFVPFFTKDPAVIAYRQAALGDLLENPALGDTLREVLPLLRDITELRRLDRDYNPSGDSYLYSITEIELYIRCVDTLHRGLSPLSGSLRSAPFCLLCERIEELSQSDYYKQLNRDLSELASRIREVKSITVGVNLDDALRPTTAGVISINQSPFKSGKVLDKILRMSFKNDALTCIAELTPLGKGENGNRKDALISALNGAMNEIFRSSVRAWRTIVGEYVLENTDFLLSILPEIEFLLHASELFTRLCEKGLPLSIAEIAPIGEKAMTLTGLYNPDVALRIEGEVVYNDFSFDDNGRFYILTGPNRGGKSVITTAVGLIQALFQLGLPVPCKTARISPVSAILTHFPTEAEDTLDKGRLGEECARLREIFDEADGDSLILLDESLSSTGAYEAAFLAEELLSAFGAMGCRGVFSTHLHELAAEAAAISRRSLAEGGIAFDTLVAGIEEGERSFLIQRRKPDGRSYAEDIAKRYGLSFEELKNKK